MLGEAGCDKVPSADGLITVYRGQEPNKSEATVIIWLRENRGVDQGCSNGDDEKQSSS